MKRRYAIVLTFVGGLAAGCAAGYAGAAQPHMQAALDSLRAARSELQAAEHNKGGHRVKAIELVDSAITETKLGIEARE